MSALIAALQILNGIAWACCAALFIPAVWRIWRESLVDPLDVLISPMAFIALLQVGFMIRWLLFPGMIDGMAASELVIWSGLYILSLIAAGGSVVAWRIARRIR